MDYPCPYCGRPLRTIDVECFDGSCFDQDTQQHEITCRTCHGKVLVTADVSVDYFIEADNTVTIDGEKVPADPDPEEVARFFKRPPQDIRLKADEIQCEVCGRRGDDACATALDYIRNGWHVAPEFPGVRVTCPNCHGGAS